MSDLKSPEAVRAEINDLLDKIPDRETLTFLLWMFRKIAAHEGLPPLEQVPALRDAFMRMMHALRDKKKIRHEDLSLVLRYTDTSGLDIRRELAATVRHLREAKGLTRREVSRLSGFPVRWLIALERGQIHDLSIPEFARLSKGLGLDAVELMKALETRLNFTSNVG
jgi:helix-turn-helix protein